MYYESGDSKAHYYSMLMDGFRRATGKRIYIEIVGKIIISVIFFIIVTILLYVVIVNLKLYHFNKRG